MTQCKNNKQTDFTQCKNRENTVMLSRVTTEEEHTNKTKKGEKNKNYVTQCKNIKPKMLPRFKTKNKVNCRLV